MLSPEGLKGVKSRLVGYGSLWIGVSRFRSGSPKYFTARNCTNGYWIVMPILCGIHTFSHIAYGTEVATPALRSTIVL